MSEAVSGRDELMRVPQKTGGLTGIYEIPVREPDKCILFLWGNLILRDHTDNAELQNAIQSLSMAALGMRGGQTIFSSGKGVHNRIATDTTLLAMSATLQTLQETLGGSCNSVIVNLLPDPAPVLAPSFSVLGSATSVPYMFVSKGSAEALSVVSTELEAVLGTPLSEIESQFYTQAELYPWEYAGDSQIV